MGESEQTVSQVDNAESVVEGSNAPSVDEAGNEAAPAVPSMSERGRRGGIASGRARRRQKGQQYETVEAALEAAALRGDPAASRELRAWRADAAGAKADNTEGVVSLEDMSDAELGRLRARLLLMAQRLERWAGRQAVTAQGDALTRVEGEPVAVAEADPAPPRAGTPVAREVPGEPPADVDTDAPPFDADEPLLAAEGATDVYAELPPPRVQPSLEP